MSEGTEGLTREERIWAFNEWMRRYIQEPDQFSREFEEVVAFLDDEEGYGTRCNAYLEALIAERRAATESLPDEPLR
jgi:hypothetical protein